MNQPLGTGSAFYQVQLAGVFIFLSAVLSDTLEAPADFTILLLRSKCEHTPHTWTLDLIAILLMTRTLGFLFACFLFSSTGYSQNLFKGKLTDKTTSEFIEGANIIILGTTTGTTSNPDGTFELEAKKKKITIVISHLSYANFQTEISSKNELHIIELEKTIYQLDGVNIRLGEYEGPTELIKFDSIKYRLKEEERINSYSNGEFVIVEDHAEFFGGMDNLKPYIASNFRYPSQILTQNLEGRAYAIFSITENGQSEDVEIKIFGEDSNDLVLTEIKRVIKAMPIWHPAYQRGNPVPVRMALPIFYAANGYRSKN